MTEAATPGVGTGAGAPRPHGASFRDPSGFVFTHAGVLYRQVGRSAAADYDRLLESGLYDRLVSAGDLVSHDEVDPALSLDGGAYKVLRPVIVPFISYPYEWSFSQLKDAALLTLRLQKAAMQAGLGLKDATPFNIAFRGSQPVWIDTSSFEVPPVDTPWVAYRQFCQLFLAPLALMSLVDVRLQDLLRSNLDGVPLDFASRLLPRTSRLRPGLLVHVHLHASAQRRVPKSAGGRPSVPRLSAKALAGIVDSLDRTVRSLEWRLPETTWGNYYDATNYSESAFAHKREIVERAIEHLAPAMVWDVGANDGTFSRVASGRGVTTIAFDIDPVAVEKNYRRAKQDADRHLLPLRLDLTNPSGRFGWANEERDALEDRGPADLVLALALVHHLAIGHNVPLDRVAQYLARIGRALLIEFVPKEDSQVRRMLASRKDIFDGYTREGFERAFARCFDIVQATGVRESARTMYVMRRRDARDNG